jgi:hypothetical protein
MLNPRKTTRRKAADETGFDHPVVFPRRLRAACFSAIGVTTAVALIIVGLFANVGLSFLPVPGLGLPNEPKTSAVSSGHALATTGGNGGSTGGGLVSASGVDFAPVAVPGGTVATEAEAPTFTTTAGGSTAASPAATQTHIAAATGIGGSTSVDNGSKATGENGKSTGSNGGGKSGGKESSTPTAPATPTPAPTTAPTEEATAVLTATGSSGSGEGAEPGSGESPESIPGGRPGKSTSTTKPGENEGEVTEEAPVEEEAPAKEPPAEEVEAPELEGEGESETEPPAESTEPPAETPAPIEELPAEPGETPPVPPAE